MQERYERLFDLFQRKSTLEKGMDSFEIVMKIENMVYEILTEIFHPYKITRIVERGRRAPDGVIRMSQNLIFYECLAGTLDKFKAYRINEIIEYARDEILTMTYPGQVYSLFIVCRDFSQEAVGIVEKQIYESVKRPYGAPIVTPETLAKLHELSTRNVKIKDRALTRILEIVGPLTINQIEEIFSELSRRKEMPFLETPTAPLRATLEYGDIKTQFEGNFDEVWRSVNRFLTDIRPSHVESALAKIVHMENLDKLVEDLQGILRIAEEGPYFISPLKNMTNKDKLLLALLGAYVGHKLGILDEDSLSIDELSAITEVKKKVSYVEASYMIRDRLVKLVEKGKRRLTTIGIDYTKRKVLPKIKVAKKEDK